MKSVERHKLETNVLAHGLEVYIERYKPYVPRIAAGIVAVIALVFIWSYVSGSSSAQKNGAWDAYNDAVGSQPMNADQLRRAAEENPGTPMQQMADVTWADYQVMMAANTFIYNRATANEALNKAASAYQSVLQSSGDQRLLGRAHLGLARVFEMQNELDKARAQYEQVGGAYAKYAKAQVERLAAPEAKDTFAWLQAALPPKPVAPMGPGVPGQRPAFSPGEIALPNGAQPGTGEAGTQKGASEEFDNLLKEIQKQSKENEKGDDRYKTDQAPADGAAPAAEGKDAAGAANPTSPAAPATEKASK